MCCRRDDLLLLVWLLVYICVVIAREFGRALADHLLQNACDQVIACEVPQKRGLVRIVTAVE